MWGAGARRGLAGRAGAGRPSPHEPQRSGSGGRQERSRGSGVARAGCPRGLAPTAARCGRRHGRLGIRGCLYLKSLGHFLSKGMWLMPCTCFTPTTVSISLFPILESIVPLMSVCERAYPWKLPGTFGPAVSLLQSGPHISFTGLQHRSGSLWLLGGGVASVALRGFGQYN